MSHHPHQSDRAPANQEAQLPPIQGSGDLAIADRTVTRRRTSPAVDLANQPQDAPTPAGGFANYLHAFRRRWFSAIAVGTVGAMAAAAATWLSASTTFTSTALIRVSAENRNLLFKIDDSQTSFDLYKGTQMQLLTSEYVLTSALRNIPNCPVLKLQDDPVRWLSRTLQTDTAQNSELVSVSLSAPDGSQAAEIVQAVVDAYMNDVVDKERKDRERRLQELTDVYTQKEIEMRSKRTELKKLAEQLGSGDMGALSLKQQLALQQFGETRATLNRIRTDLGENRAKLSAKQAAAAAQPNQDQFTEDLEDAEGKDPDCIGIHQQLDNIEARLSEMKAGLQPAAYRAESADYVRMRDALNQKLSDRRTKLADQLHRESRQKETHEGGIQELQSQIAYLAEQEKRTAALLDAEEKQTELFGNSSIDVEMLRAEIQELDKVLTAAADERQQLQVEQSSQLRIQQFQRAAVPTAADKSSRPQNLAVFGLLGFMLPIGLLLWWDVRGQRINSAHDVTQSLGVPVIGSVPNLPALRPAGKRESRRHRRMQFCLNHSIDGIAAKLFIRREDGRAHVVLVSSATRGEGKSTLSLQLAKRLARAGATTLLVDFDLRKPALHHMLEAPRGPGLSDYLRGESDLNALTRQTGVENLSVLTAGSPFSEPLGALSNGVTRSFFETIRHEYEFVIVDGTPILPVVDALLIGQHVDSVILSVRRDVSQLNRVRAACERLSAFGVEDFAAVITGTEQEPYDYGDVEPATAAEEKPTPK